MGEKRSVLRQLLDEAGLEDEALPTQCVVELLGEGRVLIENHKGVIEYGSEAIAARAEFGSVRIVGVNLRLRLMTAQKLVIVGKIDAIALERGREK